MMNRRGGLTMELSAMAILALAIGIPLLLIGGGTAIKFIQLINQPIVGGSIPIWAIFVGIIVLGLFMRLLRR